MAGNGVEYRQNNQGGNHVTHRTLPGARIAHGRIGTDRVNNRGNKRALIAAAATIGEIEAFGRKSASDIPSHFD